MCDSGCEVMLACINSKEVHTRNISIIYTLPRRYYEGESTERARMGYGAHPKLAIKKWHATHTHTHNGKCGPESSPPKARVYILEVSECPFSPNEKGHTCATSHFPWA